MPSTINNNDFRSKLAGEDLTSGQYLFVTLETDDQLDLADAITDITYGVLQNNPDEGESGTVIVSGETVVVAKAALTVGQFVGPATDGKAQVAVSTQYARGRVVKAAGAEGDLAVIQMFDTAVALV